MTREEYNKKWREDNREEFIANAKRINGGVGVQSKRVKAKKLCRELANYTCAICGGEGLDAHHILPIYDDEKADEQSNLICLCRSCHERVHKHVYVIDENKNVSINYDFIDKDKVEEKSKYVKLFEETHNVTLYKSTCGYYYFDGNNKVKVTAADMKAEYNNYNAEAIKAENERRAHKRACIKARAMAVYISKSFKESNDLDNWHKWAKICREHDYSDIDIDYIYSMYNNIKENN